ncbi:MAG TPA: hypothetical protein PLU10_09260 [Chitinophagaceae bacterium]|nr:hypothetical protein [Chitinophagaceae bacterium]
MLNLNNPRTPIIFKAATYLDRLKNDCQIFIQQPFSERQVTFKNMKQVCDEFLLFAKEHYSETNEKILALTQQMIHEINTLSLKNEDTQKGNCTVCNHPLQTWYSGVKEVGHLTTCSHCPRQIVQLLNELEYPTDVWII